MSFSFSVSSPLVQDVTPPNRGAFHECSFPEIASFLNALGVREYSLLKVYPFAIVTKSRHTFTVVLSLPDKPSAAYSYLLDSTLLPNDPPRERNWTCKTFLVRATPEKSTPPFERFKTVRTRTGHPLEAAANAIKYHGKRILTLALFPDVRLNDYRYLEKTLWNRTKVVLKPTKERVGGYFYVTCYDDYQVVGSLHDTVLSCVPGPALGWIDILEGEALADFVEAVLRYNPCGDVRGVVANHPKVLRLLNSPRKYDLSAAMTTQSTIPDTWTHYFKDLVAVL